MLIITCSILSIALVAIVVTIKGSVSGSEFAPSHFETRVFSFYEIPFLHIQITPIKRKNTTGPISRQLRAKSWINPPRGQAPTTWHLVELSRGPTGTPAVAELLTSELEIRDSTGLVWEQWNLDHPNRAAVLWPVVQRLSERELYVIIPELLLLARTLPGSDDANALSAEIDRWLVGQYAGLVKDLRDAKRTVLADEMLEEAIADYPNSPELAALRDDATPTTDVE
ncbi:MAG: hypothetical protein KDB00_17365 [Planctomycetales bacterium]|nr:hypothetical protein [Planctomycetales bacterium]